LCFFMQWDGGRITVSSILKYTASAVILLIASYPKLRDGCWKYSVETFIRFAISIGFAFELFYRSHIELWQIVAFSIMTILSGGAQIFFFCFMRSGKYVGVRHSKTSETAELEEGREIEIIRIEPSAVL